MSNCDFNDQQDDFEYATERKAYLEPKLFKRLGPLRWLRLLNVIDGKDPIGDLLETVSRNTLTMCQEYARSVRCIRRHEFVRKTIETDIPHDLHPLIHSFVGW